MLGLALDVLFPGQDEFDTAWGKKNKDGLAQSLESLTYTTHSQFLLRELVEYTAERPTWEKLDKRIECWRTAHNLLAALDYNEEMMRTREDLCE